MRAEKFPGLRDAAREEDVQRKPGQHEDAARGGEERLLPALIVDLVIDLVLAGVRRPCDGGHPGRRHGLDDGGVADLPRIVGDRHASVEHIEGEPFGAADQRADRTPERRDLVGAIEPAHLVGAAGAQRGHRRRVGRAAATRVDAMAHMPRMMVLCHAVDITKRRQLHYHASARNRGGRRQAASGSSAIVSPEPPSSAGKSLSLGRPSRMGSTVSA